ncbi:MAG: hypothetical protein WDA24_10245 [Tissierellales bacterium]
MSQYKELINNNIGVINKLQNLIRSKIEKNEIYEDIYELINTLIDSFVNVVNLIRQFGINDEELDIAIEGISNKIVTMIQCFNHNKTAEGVDILQNQIFNKLDNISVILNKIIKYRIIIYGLNEISIKVKELINYNSCELICFISSDSNYIHRKIDGIEIISYNQMSGYAYDYLIITDTDVEVINKMLMDKKLNEEQIFNYIYYIYAYGFYASPEFFINYSKFLNSNKKYDGIITGISYTQKGICTELLRERFFSFANPTQDLFYDHEMMKLALSFLDVKETIKYVIIGLCYYSFQYDLSRSIQSNRCNYYYLVTKSYHNYSQAEKGEKFLSDFNKVSNKILIENHDRIFIEGHEEKYIEIINKGKELKFDSSLLSEVEKEKCIDAVKQEFNKDYPLTVEENKAIFKEYLELLYSHNIKPVIAIPPETRLYRDNISQRIKDEFYSIINEFQKKYDFQFLDYFYSDYFDDSDFYDVSHLNNKGSEKWTKLLDKDIWG